MSVATVTSKGQVTIPKDIREALGLGQGDRLEFVAQDDGSIRLIVKTRRLADLIGVLPTERRATDEQIDDAIRAGWSGR